MPEEERLLKVRILAKLRKRWTTYAVRRLYRLRIVTVQRLCQQDTEFFNEVNRLLGKDVSSLFNRKDWKGGDPHFDEDFEDPDGGGLE